MLPKALIIITTVLVGNLALTLFQRDMPGNYIPLIQSLNQGRVAAFDLFLVISLVMLRLAAQRLGISLATLKSALSIFSHRHTLVEILVLIGVGAATQFFGVPIFFGIFQDPIRAMASSPDGIRQVCFVNVIILWALTIGLLAKSRGRTVPYSPPPSMPPVQMPPPPQNW